MADQFDAIDVIYEWLEPSKYKIYKDKAPIKPTVESFIVLLHPVESGKQRINIMPVTINIYHKKNPNGMISRSDIKAKKDKVIELIKNGTSPGYLFDMTYSNSYINTEYSKEYDIYVIRYDLTISADI